jgi:hypothetical protein
VFATGDPEGDRFGAFRLLPEPLLKRELEERLEFRSGPDRCHTIVLNPHFVKELAQQPVPLLL